MDIEIYPANKKQQLFLDDRHRHIAFGGARGGGKSYAVRVKAISMCLTYPGIVILIIRKTYPELMANHIKPLKKMLSVGMADSVVTYNDSRKELVFPNGSTILFGYCNSESDVDRYQGTEVDILMIDEATLLSEEQIKALTACVRGVNGYPKRIYYTCNPGGKGHAYIKRLFVDRDFLPSENPDDYSFIQSLVTDNTALMASDPDYIHQLEALPEQLKKAWLYGDWNTFVGQAFPEWRDVPEHYNDHIGTHVIAPFKIPSDWGIWCGLDWGYSKPFSVHWYAVDRERRMYCIREYYGCSGTPNEGVRLEPTTVARRIKEIEDSEPFLKGKKIHRVGDPAIWGTQGTESIGALMERERVYFEKGDHARLSGKMQCHHRLAFDENGRAMFYVFNTCKNFIRTVPQLIYDDHNVEDIDTDGEDHIYDEWRYVCMKNPIAPPIYRKADPKPYDPLDIANDDTKKVDRYEFYRKY